MKSINFSVEHQCPQCGAPVVLKEETRFFVCNFCRVRSLIAQKGFFRYYFSPGPDVPGNADLIFLPYWRFKGVRYHCDEKGVGFRFLDLSALALESLPGIPFSLGFRSQALPLKLIAPDTRGQFVRPLPFKGIIAAQEIHKKPGPGFSQEIGETMSLIYAPFYKKGNDLMDGVLNQPFASHPKAGLDAGKLHLCRPETDTRFVSGLCPECGGNLDGDADSLALICRNCQSLWRARGGKLARIRYGSATLAQPDDVMVPFWRIRAHVGRLSLSSYADLVRMGNLPRAIQPEWENKPLYFWAPAFKIQPKIFLRLATGFGVAQPAPSLSKILHKNTHLPVALPPSEAVQTVRICLASLVRPLSERLPILKDTPVTPETVDLIFLPFESRPHDLVFPDLNLAIPKINLALSTHL